MSIEKSDMPVKKDFLVGRRLGEYLELKGWKSAYLAKITGLTRSTISDAINEVHDLTAQKIEQIVRHTDISPAWLLTGEGSPIKSEYQLSGVLEKARRVLEGSDPVLKSALEANIHAFSSALEKDDQIRELKTEVKRLKNPECFPEEEAESG